MGNIYNWGIIGCGYIAKTFTRSFEEINNAKILACASLSGKAEAFAKEMGILQFYNTYEELLSNPEIDIVYIATTNETHYELMKMSLEHGKHVLCEKPFTLNHKQAAKVIKLAREKNLFIMEAMWTRFIPAIIELNRLLDENIIGDIKALQGDFCVIFKGDSNSRIFNINMGGGALLDLGVYPIAFVCMIMKGLPINAISSVEKHMTGVDESSVTIFEFENGIKAVISFSATYEKPIEFVVSGTKGYIRIPMFYVADTLYIKKDGENEIELKIPYKSNGMQYEALEVMDCIDNNRHESLIMSHSDTLKIMKIMDSLRRDWKLKYPQEISE